MYRMEIIGTDLILIIGSKIELELKIYVVLFVYLNLNLILIKYYIFRK